MTAAGDSVEQPGAVDHLIKLGYRDPLDEATRHARELRAEAAQLQQAQACLRAGQFAGAIGLLHQIVSAAPDRTAPRRLLSQAYFNANQLKQARETLRSLELDGVEDAELALLRAAIASRQRQFDEALDLAQYALCLRQPLPAADLIIGEAYRRTERLAEAETAFDRAVQHDSARAAACVGLAAVSQRRGEHEQAVDRLLAVLDIDMTAWAAHYRLGLSLMTIGRSREAQVAFETCLQLQPAVSGPWRHLARIFADHDDVPAAEKCRDRGRLAVRQRRLARSTGVDALAPNASSSPRQASP